MISAILDTNVVVQSLIGGDSSTSVDVLDALFSRSFQLVYSSDVLNEWLEVLITPHIRDLHQLSDDEIVEFLSSLLPNAIFVSVDVSLPHSLTRDITDTKFLALAQSSAADYLITNDRRHLLPLARFGNTRIVLPGQFMRELTGPIDPK